MFDGVLESPGFWLLGGGAITAELIGWIWSKKAGWEVLPLWQLIVIMVISLIAAAFFGADR